MDNGTWNRLKEIYHEAVDKPPGERVKLLDDACAGNGALRAELEELLRVHDRGDPDEPAEVVTGPGTLIGRYKILEKIGEGGFGVVYMAEQAEPLRRQVALKVIRPGMGTRQVIARFEAERQALALMDHPNIARVLDAGSTGGEVGGESPFPLVAEGRGGGAAMTEGRPYFVMELVRGIPITQYCDQCGLTLRQRLELFLSACQAVQHAHQKGIIHRDIKPSNVLTAIQNGGPVVKVIDFGVAKAINQRLTEHSVLTGFAQMLGTPLYMSPEQAEMSPLDVDTRSDIYSLGVLLYELLTGTTPFERDRLNEVSFDELRRIIREEETPPPSIRLSTLGDRTARVAEHRRTVPEKLRQLIRGDLDWIVMKALEKDRSRRYETADGFARDVQRHLGDEPVEARPPSAAYKFRKFCRRNKLAIMTIGLVAVALVIGAGVSTWQAVRATRAKAEADAHALRADRQARVAETEAAIAREANDFINDVLAQADPNNEPDRHLELRTVLDRAAEKIEGRFQGRPLVEASVRTTLGKTYAALGEYDKAEQHQERAREIYLAELGPEHVRTLARMSGLGGVYRDQGRYPEAEMLCQEGLEIARRVLGPEHPETLVTMNDLAVVYYSQGRYPDAEKLHAQVLEIKSRVLGPEHPQTLGSKMNLAIVQKSQGRVSEAEKLFQEVLEVQRRVLGPEHPNTLSTMNSLAVVYDSQRRDSEAEKLYQEVLEIQRRVLGPEHPHTLMSMGNLAALHGVQGRYPEGEKLYTQVFEIFQRVLGPEHPHTLATKMNIAIACKDRGRDSEAEKLHQEVLEVRRRVLGPEHPDTLSSMNNLALVYDSQRRYPEAEKLHQEVLEVRRRRLMGPEHPLTLSSMNNLAEVYRHQRRYAEAEKLHQEVLEARRRVLGPEHPDTLGSKMNLAILCNSQGRYAEAEKLHEEVLEVERRVMGPEHPDTLASKMSLAIVYYNQGRNSEAEKLHEEVLEVRRRVLGPEHPDTLSSMNKLAEVYRRQARHADAEKLDQEVLEVQRRVLGTEHPDTLASMNNLALAYNSRGRYPDAEKLNQEVLEVRRRVLGPEHPDALGSMNNMGLIYTSQGRHAEAEKLCQEVLEAQRRVLGPEHPHTLVSMYNLALVHARLGRVEEAIQLHEEAIQLHERTLPLRRAALGPHHRDVLTSVEHLTYSYNYLAWRAVASADLAERDPTRGVELARKALELAPKSGDIWNTLGVAQYRAGLWHEAIAALEKSVEVSKGGTAGDYFFLAMAHWELASREVGEPASSRALARELYERAVEWMKQKAPEDEELLRFRAEAAELLGTSAPPEAAPKEAIPETGK